MNNEIRTYTQRVLLLAGLLAGPSISLAQISFDGTLGPAGSLTGPQMNIPAESGKLVDKNLFHSFSLFNVRAGEKATFTGPDSVANVISRVTGGSASRIDGTLSCAIPRANLYLLNKAGVLVGPDAVIDVDGAFHTSDADFIELGDGARFHAVPSPNDLLTTAPPSAFGFLPETLPAGQPQPPAPDAQAAAAPAAPSAATAATAGTANDTKGAFPVSGVILDGSTGPGGTIAGPDYAIPAALGTLSGPNLFHSFQQFNIGNRESATFSGPGSVRNVIGRVTGGSGSQIDGKIACTIAGADLYLLNPNGLIFGEGAVLDLQGSFHAGTAHYLTFSDGAVFPSTPLAGERLSTATPQAFGFEAKPVAALTVAGSQFAYDEGETLSLVGGKVTVNEETTLNRWTMTGGRLNIAAVQSAGELKLNASTLDTSSFSLLGDVTLDSVKLDASGLNHAGEVFVRGANVALDNTEIYCEDWGWGNGSGRGIDIQAQSLAVGNGTILSVDTYGAGNGPSLRLAATGNLSIDNGSALQAISRNDYRMGGNGGLIDLSGDRVSITRSSLLDARTIGKGDSGGIRIAAAEIALSDGSSLDASSKGVGDAGNISLTASRSTTLSSGGGLPSLIRASTESTAATAGKGGDVLLSGGAIDFADGSLIESKTSGPGRGGSVRLATPDNVTFRGADSQGYASHITLTETEKTAAGNTGNATIEAKNILFSDGAYISAGTRGSGNAGNVVLKAGEDISFTGESPRWLRSVDVVAQSWQSPNNGPVHVSSGNGGSVTIEARNLTMANGASISAGTTGTGNGGNIDIKVAGRLALTGARSKGEKYATEIASVAQPAFSGTRGGNGGGINISAGALSLTDGGLIVASTIVPTAAAAATSGSAGNIVVNAGSISLAGVNPYGENDKGFGSGIYAQSSGSGNTVGAGGAISVTAGSLALSGGGVISSSTSGNAPGGNVTLAIADAANVSGDSAGTTLSTRGTSQNRYRALTGKTGADYSASGIYANSQGSASATGPGGNVTLAAQSVTVADGARISTSTQGRGNAGAVKVDAGQVNLSAGSIASTSESTGAGGAAGQVSVTASSSAKLANNSTLSTSTRGQGAAGAVELNAGALEITGRSTVSSASESTGAGGDAGHVTVQVTGNASLGDGAAVETSTAGAGKAGEIDLAAANVEISGAAAISSISKADGQGGNAGTITVKASDTLALSGAGQITTSSRGAGNAGAVSVSAARLRAIDAFISSSSESTGAGGDAGAVNVSVSGDAELGGGNIETSTAGLGRAGAIEMSVGSLRLTAHAAISSVSESSGAGGDAGSIAIQAHGAVQLNNGSTVNTSSKGAGQAGTVVVQAASLSLADRSAISSSSESTGTGGDAGTVAINTAGAVHLDEHSEISTSSAGSGNAGAVRVACRSMNLSGAASIQSSSESTGAGGDAGTVAVRVSDNLTLNGAAKVSTSTAGGGNAGDVVIQAGNLNMSGNAAISSTSESAGRAGRAGTIRVQSADSIELRSAAISTEAQNAGGGHITISAAQTLYLVNGRITTSVRGGDGNGGNLDINATFIILNNSKLIANAFGGRGGNIHITADYFIKSADSIVSASSALGIDGLVQIDSLDVDLGSDLIILPSTYLDASRWAIEKCSARAGEKVSRFVLVGRDSLPPPVSEFFGSSF